MLGKGNVGRPDTPGVSTAEMQRIMDELPREVPCARVQRACRPAGGRNGGRRHRRRGAEG